MFSKKATKIEEIIDLTVCSKCQIDGEEFVKYCGLLKKKERKSDLATCLASTSTRTPYPNLEHSVTELEHPILIWNTLF